MRRFTIAPEPGRASTGRAAPDERRALERRDGDPVTFDRDETRHLARVLRLRPGDTIVASDGSGRDLTVRLETIGETATGTVLGVTAGAPESPLRLTLLQGIPKGDKMETIVRAATELGVARVWPVVAERTVVRLEPGRWRERARRWQRVAREATKQCGRTVIPEVDIPRPLAEWLDRLEPPAPAELRLCLWEGEAPPLHHILAPQPRVLDRAPRATDALLLIGPEGGLAREEVERARAHGFVVTSLGRRILRTETAGPAVAAILQWTLGDLGAP